MILFLSILYFVLWYIINVIDGNINGYIYKYWWLLPFQVLIQDIWWILTLKIGKPYPDIFQYIMKHSGLIVSLILGVLYV